MHVVRVLRHVGAVWLAAKRTAGRMWEPRAAIQFYKDLSSFLARNEAAKRMVRFYFNSKER